MSLGATKYIGRRIPRREDPRFLRGATQYVDDIALPRMVHAAFVRSTHAHAVIRAVSADAVKRQPGFVGILTGRDIFEPLDFIARLAALVPKPRVNLTRFHGVFAPNSRYRARVTPAKRGRGSQRCSTGDSQAATPGERRASMAGFLLLQNRQPCHPWQ